LELNSKYGRKCEGVDSGLVLAALYEDAYFDLRGIGHTRGDLLL